MIRHSNAVSRITSTKRGLELNRSEWEKLLVSGQEIEGVQSENLAHYLGKLNDIIEGLSDIFPECIHFPDEGKEVECSFGAKKLTKYSRS